jgi:hypothetical protein
MADGEPPQPPPQPSHDVPLEERGIDLNTVFTGVAALGSVASAGAAWYAVTRPSDQPQDPPVSPPPKIELPPGVGEDLGD